ncbi:MAG: sigma D regulator [Gammaproteobacteria bacterium]|nr:sigma D regulator [Gammaproteobacteria bacterium]MCP4982357.1 sigma D regulator [Gammaproteobacteria bacterium]
MSDSQIEKIAQIAERISAEENRRTRQTHTIGSLLQERQQVLVSMCELAELESGDIPPDTVMHNLRNFNQQLVDYTALGHFEIYERIIDGKERRGNVKLVANRVYPVISGTTQLFVDFNDKYEGADDPDSLTDLYNDLSSIGEAMAERIESEDMLLREISDNLESPSKTL